jgi:spoIIIJ-associated protein
VADYKKQRANRLAQAAQEWVDKVKETGEQYDVRPMNAADRRVVHKLAAESGIASESVGEGRDRHIVLKPAV